ncbi:MAG: hydantoinase/oxoprolinase family protein [Thermomicrobiales bacterium]|nr:hydantoinase/oxoprolinase family protein [Thermomicrobiales bacterium]
MSLRIGIDVGGTNTDGVLMQGGEVISWAKHGTTHDVTDGIQAVLRDLLGESIAPGEIDSVMIGTTHFTNAVVQRRDLVPTAALRICLPAGEAIPPLYDWPEDMQACVGNHRFMVHGGHEFDGREISALDEPELTQVADYLIANQIESLAITGVFAPVSPDHEERATSYFLERLPELNITESHQIGRLSLLERENATALNASLAPLAKRTVAGFKRALDVLGISASLYITQNDGTLMSAEFAERYPVLTFSSGPTNSMRGAAALTGLQDGIVIDIGGTTTDVGMLVAGFPREASFAIDIGGVRTNFRMPDLVSIGLGGGSIVRDGGLRLGPDSVGYEIREKALVFGGDTLVATDIAVAGGWADVGDPSLVASVDEAIVKRGRRTIHEMISRCIDTIRTSSAAVPIVLVGGGSILVHDELAGASDIHRPDHYLVANAIGAAIAQVSGEVDQVFSLEGTTRQQVLLAAENEARAKAVLAGAREDTIEVVEIEEIPLPYLPSSAIRIRVKTVGSLD